MKKLLSVFLIMFIVSCGIAYGGNSNENAIGISGLGGHSYRVIALMPGFPLPFFTVFSFDESGNFTAFEKVFGQPSEDVTGYYTENESAFTAHCEFLAMGVIPHEIDCEGTSILGIFIFGSFTLQSTVDDEVLSSDGFFFGRLSILGEFL